MAAFKKVAAFGLGLLDLTEEKARELVDEIVKRGEAKQEESEGLVKDLLERAQAAGESVRKAVDKQVAAALKKFKLVSADEIARLEARIAELEDQLRREPPR